MAKEMVIHGGYRHLQVWRCVPSSDWHCLVTEGAGHCGGIHADWMLPALCHPPKPPVVIEDLVLSSATGESVPVYVPGRENGRAGRHMWVPNDDRCAWEELTDQRQPLPEAPAPESADEITFAGRRSIGPAEQERKAGSPATLVPYGRGSLSAASPSIRCRCSARVILLDSAPLLMSAGGPMNAGFERAAAPLALFTLATLLAGCSDNSSSGSKHVTVWMYPVIADPKANSEYWARIEEDFEKAVPGVLLTVEQQPWENRDQRVDDAFGGGRGPDVVLLTPDQIPRFATDGVISPVDGALKDSVGRFLPASMDAMKQNGKIYGAPIYQTVTTTIYNKKLLIAAGVTTPPATWDEIKAAAPKLKKDGVALLDYSASNEASLNLNFYPLLWQAGGRVFSEDGKKVAFNSSEGVEALTFLSDLYKAGSVPKSSMTNTNLLADQALGKQQAALGYSVVLADADLAAKTWGPGNVLVGDPLEGPAKEVAFGIPGALSVNAKSENRACAEKFLTFMIQPEQIKSLGRASGYFSPRTDVTVPTDSPFAKQYQAALANVFPGEPHPAARRLMGLLAPEVQAALTGKKSPKEALDSAAKAAEELLARQR